jgi:hypothetical protein
MQSLRLLHHYSTEVYMSLSRDPAMADLWKTIVPETAFTNVSVPQTAFVYPRYSNQNVVVYIEIPDAWHPCHLGRSLRPHTPRA